LVPFGIPGIIILDRDTIFLSALWTKLWEKMDTKSKRSTTFHPQTDGKIKVVNRDLVQLLRGYNQKHPNTWDDNLVYIQHYYNLMNHTYTRMSPFEICFGHFIPSLLDISYGKQGVKEDIIGDALRAKKIMYKIRQINLQV